MSPVFFAAAPEDAPALSALQVGSFDRPWSTLNIARAISAPGGFAIGAGARDAPAGFALARTVLDEAELMILVVRVDQRGRGLGFSLTQAAADEAAARGARALLLEVATDNQRAIDLYSRAGFRAVGMRRGYYERIGGARADARVLRLDL